MIARIWTEAETKQATRLYADGATAREIAISMGGGLTRNAVIGRLTRVGVMGASRAALGTHRVKTRKSRAGMPSIGVGPVVVKSIIPSRPRPMLAPFTLPSLKSKSGNPILELRDDLCRFPVGDPMESDFRYCLAPGADNRTGRPYCDHHHALCYNGAPKAKPSKADLRALAEMAAA